LLSDVEKGLGEIGWSWMKLQLFGFSEQLQPMVSNTKSFTITLYPFTCSIKKGEIVLHEHCAISWLEPNKLHTLDWAEADLPVVESYLSELSRAGNA